MINAAFRLPEVSLRYLHQQILDSASQGTPLSLEQLQEEIAWRERSHHIDSRSAYSLTADTGGVPPEDADALPPLVTSIQPGTAASFPLKLSHADDYIGDGAGARTVLVGDAAHTIHPLAGQGLNMGLGDVESLFHCIHRAVLNGGDIGECMLRPCRGRVELRWGPIGSRTALLPYARERYFENHKILSACDKLHKLYSSTSQPVVWARSVGLEVLNEFDTVKAAIMLNAGSRSTRTSPLGKQFGVNFAADAVGAFAQNLSGMSTLTRGFAGMVGDGMQKVLQTLANSQRRP